MIRVFFCLLNSLYSFLLSNTTLNRAEWHRAARQGPYQTNLLIAGWDAASGPSMYFLDYMASLHKMNCTGHGYGALQITICPCATCSALPVLMRISRCPVCIAPTVSSLLQQKKGTTET